METPQGNVVRWKKLEGPRWRLSMGDHQLFIEKSGSGIARLEHRNGDEIGTYTDWNQAVRDALRIFDKWKTERKRDHVETVEESTELAELDLMIQNLLDEMSPLESRLGDLVPFLTDDTLRGTLEQTDWAIVTQAVKFTKSMLRRNDLHKERLLERREDTK